MKGRSFGRSKANGFAAQPSMSSIPNLGPRAILSISWTTCCSRLTRPITRRTGKSVQCGCSSKTSSGSAVASRCSMWWTKNLAIKKVTEVTMRFLLLAALVAAQAFGQAYQPTEANLKARESYQNARFGMFIHWGVYSVLGDGEWVMNTRKITVAEYEKLAPKFDPTEYDAAAWVALAKAAGMKYITITSKHHDGFAMWGTKQNHWNIVDATPYKKDVLKMLADECHRQGIKLFFYHSQLDWHNTDYYPRGNTGKTAGRPESGNFDRYLDFMDSQLRELLTGYGDIAGIWFDGMWDKPRSEERRVGKECRSRWSPYH